MMKLSRKQDMMLNGTLLNMIGRSYGEIRQVWGEAQGIYAYGGEIGFLFNNAVYYYFMDEYDVTVAEPKDGSICYGAGCRVNTCIQFMENRPYSFEELREKLGLDIKSYITDDEDEIGAGFSYTHEFSCGRMNFRFYSDSLTRVSPNSIMFVCMG